MNNNTDSEGNSNRNGNQESDATPKPLPLKRIIWWSVSTVLVLIGIFGLIFGWAREYKWFDPNYVIDHEVWGTFGDFVGGVLGIFLSLLACILMVWTFHEQRKLTYQTNQLEERLATKNERFQKELTKSTNDQAELQRFNDLFFHLLELYRDQNAILNQSVGNQNFFDSSMRTLRKEFKIYEHYGHAYRYAGEKYLEFYDRHAWKLAPQFRILYRIFKLIDEAKINDDARLEYAKIMRGNLSEGELFFLRYNGQSHYGKAFVNLINKYRLLKHLPYLSLLEAKNLRDKIESVSTGIPINLNIIFYKIAKEIFNRCVGKLKLSNDPVVIETSAKYKLFLIFSRPESVIIKFVINNNIKKTPKRLQLLDSFSPNEISDILYNVTREIFIFSNFDIYNKNINIKKLPLETFNPNAGTNLTVISISVNNESPIRLSHPAWDESYGISCS